MNKGDFSCQLVITEHTQQKKDGRFLSITKQMPTFILPNFLGLMTMENAKKTCYEMFYKFEVHGCIMDYEYKTLTF